MASERIQRHIDRSLDEADQAVANEDLPTVASRARAVRGWTMRTAMGSLTFYAHGLGLKNPPFA